MIYFINFFLSFQLGQFKNKTMDDKPSTSHINKVTHINKVRLCAHNITYIHKHFNCCMN